MGTTKRSLWLVTFGVICICLRLGSIQAGCAAPIMQCLCQKCGDGCWSMLCLTQCGLWCVSWCLCKSASLPHKHCKYHTWCWVSHRTHAVFSQCAQLLHKTLMHCTLHWKHCAWCVRVDVNASLVLVNGWQHATRCFFVGSLGEPLRMLCGTHTHMAVVSCPEHKFVWMRSRHHRASVRLQLRPPGLQLVIS